MIIRPGEQKDIAPILQFWNGLIRNTTITFSTTEHTPSSLQDMMDTRPIFLVAEQNGRAQALATYKQFRAGNGYRHTMEHTIIVDPASHRAGLATALMDALETHAKAKNVQSLIAAVTADNAPAIAFHAARGYTNTGVLLQAGRKFDNWLDLVFMQKHL